MLGKMTAGESRRPAGQLKSWHRCLLDLKAFDATKGFTQQSKLVFGVEARCGPLQLKRRASGIAGSSKQKNASWLSGMRNEAALNRNRHASATGDAQGNRKGGGLQLQVNRG